MRCKSFQVSYSQLPLGHTTILCCALSDVIILGAIKGTNIGESLFQENHDGIHLGTSIPLSKIIHMNHPTLPLVYLTKRLFLGRMDGI